MGNEGRSQPVGDKGSQSVNVTRILRGMALFVVLCATLVAVGCSPRAKAAAPPPSVIGLWEMASAKGKAASLSQIGFGSDGTFKHMGHNALGRPVTFQGIYRLGGSEQGPVIELTYDDFPDRPTRWFFRIDGNDLRVAVVAQDLNTENALEFTRAQEQ